ncbi:MAG: Ribosomal protein S6--L-glutamate ligase [Pseudomonadota bacterium]
MILIVSYPGDEHTDRVQALLAQAGREVVRIDLADFPVQREIDFAWPAQAAPHWRITHEGRWVDLAATRAVWWRRVTDFAVDPALGLGEGSAFAHSETAQAVDGMLDSLDCAWMNPRDADAAAHHKPYQWTLAQRLGLKLPRTLVTTSAQAARAFIDDVRPGRVVFKAFLAAVHQWRETRMVEQEDLDRLDLVRYAPVIFQEYVPGVDLRITLVGDEVHAVEIDARETSYEVDMRMVVGEARMNAVTLPPALQSRLRALQQQLGLAYGAVDMRRTAQGEYIFLEVNPAGQWLFVEERCGLRISQAVADFLAQAADRTPPARRGHTTPRTRAGKHADHAVSHATHPG